VRALPLYKWPLQTRNAQLLFFLSVLIDVLLQERGREKEKWREVWAVVFGV
jgi:hypothetical protein